MLTNKNCLYASSCQNLTSTVVSLPLLYTSCTFPATIEIPVSSASGSFILYICRGRLVEQRFLKAGNSLRRSILCSSRRHRWSSTAEKQHRGQPVHGCIELPTPQRCSPEPCEINQAISRSFQTCVKTLLISEQSYRVRWEKNVIQILSAIKQP